MSILTGISEVEVIFDVTRDVVGLFVLYPVCICLLVISDENSKQDDHSYLPDEAHGGQADPHISVLLRTQTCTTVFHFEAFFSPAASLCSGLRSGESCLGLVRLQQHLPKPLRPSGGVCHRGRAPLTCQIM